MFLKKYKNAFLDLIRKHQINPGCFATQDTLIDGRSAFIMKLKGSRLRFEVVNEGRSFHKFRCSYTKFDTSFTELGYIPENWIAIAPIYDMFERWLREHVREYLDESSMPDLWQQIELQKPLVSGSRLEEADMAPFSEKEKTQLQLSINEFRVLIVKTFQPSQDQLKVITDRLDYLSVALDRLNRIDWRGLAIWTMLSISVALGLDTEKGRVLFALFKQIFTKVVHLLQ